jgi:23S rRNA U2552 (ribose-2'-O)-methylase RlmE/FtsJ
MMQKKGGHFVLKVFDTFSSSMIELMYLLTYLYEEVSITKPLTSRPANSEKYILCTKFKMVHKKRTDERTYERTNDTKIDLL